MAVNPAKTGTALNNPTQRANELNDPQFSNQQGYFSYDLTHQELVTPRFGEITPTMHLHTVPGDRIVNRDDTKCLLNKVNGNLLSQLNQYVDTFYIPLRSLLPTNYEKLIPNPTKGDDLPNSALPQFPIAYFVHTFLHGQDEYHIGNIHGTMHQIMNDPYNFPEAWFPLFRMYFLCTIFSRGQLLDYLGCTFDSNKGLSYDSDYQRIVSDAQKDIDNYMRVLCNTVLSLAGTDGIAIFGLELDLLSNSIDKSTATSENGFVVRNLSEFRDAISTIFERGQFPFVNSLTFGTDSDLENSYKKVKSFFDLFYYQPSDEQQFEDYGYIGDINTSSNPFSHGHINLSTVLAYQQVVAQYFSNDSVDNIFNSDLFMQNLRSVMFPADPGNNMFISLASEPTFNYNGVSTEYDYISAGALYSSLISSNIDGNYNRQWVWSSIMLLLRRSLRYGDYFSTARPRMLAVGQLSIPVGEDGMVSPIDVTDNLLKQRYLNAVNRIGSGFLPYMASIHGVMPSDTGTFPRFIGHRKIELANNVITNTAQDQGHQVTNILGVSDRNGFDVFIDDFGVVLSLTSFDVLPLYKTGVESTFHLADRFDYFNPMLQGIGDQPILRSELICEPQRQPEVFGYTMRNGEYKYKTSRAHGAFVNWLPGFLVTYPLSIFTDGNGSIKIDPDFIRDKPAYLDPTIPENDGVSPGEYYHFVVSCTNELKCARKIQATPPVLF